MHHDKQDEDLQTGKPLPVEPKIIKTEKDADEQVHQQKSDVPLPTGEQDIDQLVHQHPSPTEVDPMKETDPDERVHDADQASFGSE